MMVMRRPKKASSLRSPRGVERWGGTEQGTRVPYRHHGCPGERLLHPPTPALTVLVEEEEEEGVHDGDEDPTPEGDAAGWQGGALDTCPSAERGHGGGWEVPVGRLTGRPRAG